MALPAGVSTFTLNFGRPTDFVGSILGKKITIKPSHDVLMLGTLQTVALPHTDQEGFVDLNGDAITDFWYTIDAETLDSTGRTVGAVVRRLVQVTSDVTDPVDLEMIPSDTVVSPVGSVPLPAITSVNGATGVVLEDGESASGVALGAAMEDGSHPLRVAANAAIDERALALLDPSTVIFEPSRFPGCDPTGETSSKAALQTAVRETPRSGTLLIPAGTYLIQGGTASIANFHGPTGTDRKSIRIVGTDALIINDIDNAVFDFTSRFVDEHVVDSLSVIDVPNDNAEYPGSNKGVRLNFTHDLDWKRGDLVKLVADDPIPEDRPESSGKVARAGTNLRVHEVSTSEGYVIALGTLVDSYTINVRVAKYGDETAVLEGVSYDITDARLAATSGYPLAVFRSMVSPRVLNVDLRRLTSTGISFESCHAYEASVSAGFAYDNPVVSSLGYVINDKASTFGRAWIEAGAVRHAFTTNTSQVVAGTDLYSYGRSFYSTVSGKVSNATNAAFDTHHGAYGTRFVDVEVVNSTVGGAGIRVYEESGGGQTRFTVIKSPTIVDSLVPIDMTFAPTGHPDVGTRISIPVEVQQPLIRRARQGCRFENAYVRIQGGTYHAASTVVADSAAYYLKNTSLRLHGGPVIDYGDTATGSGVRVYDQDPTVSSTFEVFGLLDFRHSPAGVVSTLIRNAANTILRVGTVRATQMPPTVLNTAPVPGSWLEWFTLQNATSSESLTVTGSSIADAAILAPLGRTNGRDLVLECDPNGSNRTLATLPAAMRRGTRLAIIHRGTANTVTVTHGGNVLLSAGASLALNAGEILQLVYGSLDELRWRSCVERVGIAVASHQGPGGDHCALSDDDAAENGDVRAKPRTVTDRDWRELLAPASAIRVRGAVVCGRNQRPRPDCSIVADVDPACGEQVDRDVDEDARAYTQPREVAVVIAAFEDPRALTDLGTSGLQHEGSQPCGDDAHPCGACHRPRSPHDRDRSVGACGFIVGLTHQ
ncbi:hypothetical protein QYM36_019439 [Artemia franciscana]|uniref:Depolymerase 2 capsule K5-specific C-terminal domain-containing protein n=1 Tax=Artemia franciscana TaxID=6661 RepID=A0AA88KQZ3_ARTSF|nr:hypothetical protein QYM36_019439 [Artemia franciscana]